MVLVNSLDWCRSFVRKVMGLIARLLNTLSGGHITPNMITLVGLLAHVAIAFWIALGALVTAGVWLIVFGLFDTLDGELARLQKRDSPAGMFLDSVTDRMKEILIYIGVGAYMLSNPGDLYCAYDYGGDCFFGYTVPGFYANHVAVLAIAVLGLSMLTSYINAWGEAVMGRAGASAASINKTFRGGLGSFEVRMALIVVGLLTNHLTGALVVVGLLVSFTIVSRFYKVLGELKRVQG